VDPVPDKIFIRKSGSAWNRTRTPGSVARSIKIRRVKGYLRVLVPVRLHFQISNRWNEFTTFDTIFGIDIRK
jgi:hypothetical protein